MLTQAQIKQKLSYDAETGVFTWIVGKKMSGKIAGTHDNGYLRIRINKKAYLAHRLAWMYVHGEFPSTDLDHENRVASDNSIANLRECTPNQNKYNVGMMRTNTSGFKGVSWQEDRGKWLAQITINGKIKNLGRFLTPELASAAYEAKARELHGAFYRNTK